MSRSGESREHKEIKQSMSDFLSEKFGPSLTEFMDDGDRTDVTGYTIDGIKIRVEIIWSESQFHYDMENIIASDAKIKILVINPSILLKKSYDRNVERRKLSESNKNVFLLGPYDANLILNGDDGCFSNIYQDIKQSIEITLNQDIITSEQIKFNKNLDYRINKSLEYLNKDISKFEEEVDNIIMMFKERIDKWDATSVKHGTKKLFENYYDYSGKESMNELYIIFRDIFDYAYVNRKRILELMVTELHYITMNSWVKGYNIEKGEKSLKLLLRLGIKYLNIDLSITKTCYEVIDIWSADFFEPELFSKQIIFGAVIFERLKQEANLKSFFDDIVYDIKQNDYLSWDAGKFDYLIRAIDYAEKEQHLYSVVVEEFKKLYLIPVINENIESQLDISELLSEDYDKIDGDHSFKAGLISKIISSYNKVRPDVAFEIQVKILRTKDDKMIEHFKEIIKSDNYLLKIYEDGNMMTTLDDFIFFLETNLSNDEVGVGFLPYAIIIHFSNNMNYIEESKIRQIIIDNILYKKYEINDQKIVINRLLYREKSNLINLINEINTICKIIGIEMSFSYTVE